MKTFTTFIALMFCFVFFTYAQDININFTAQGAASTIDQVVATNLSTEQSITIPGGQTLVLRPLATGIESLGFENHQKVSPNPYSSYTHLLLPLEEEQKVRLLLSDLSGTVLMRYEQLLDRGTHRFQIAAENSGVYLMSVETAKGNSCSKIVQMQSSKNQIDYSGGGSIRIDNLKSSTADYVLNYSPNDFISYAISSGGYTTMFVESPATNKTLTVDMIECKDGDGNNYPVVKIGEQYWMAKDIKTTKYSDGTVIANVANQTSWYNLGDNLTDKAYCIYNNNANGEKDIYGALYTYAAAVNGIPQSGTNKVQGVCPTGWHVPSYAEFNVLVTSLGGSSVAGGKLKATGTEHWFSPNTGATNASGFNARPNGYRENADFSTSYNDLGRYALWWTSVSPRSSFSQLCIIYFDSAGWFAPEYNKSNGLAVRCIKD